MIDDALIIIGAAVIAYGIWLVSIPAAVVMIGVALVFTGLVRGGRRGPTG